ncbi:serine-rich adhesin for platelets-like isoform X2 [Haliotis asinina]
MRPRQRRGESFNVAKSTNRREEKRTSHDPPWQRPPDKGPNQLYQGNQGQQDSQNQGRRHYLEAEHRDAVSHGVSRSRQLASAKSTPSLNQDLQQNIPYSGSTQKPSISPAKSSPNISEDIVQESRYGNPIRPKRLDVRGPRSGHHPPSPNSAWIMYNKESGPKYQKPRPNMYTNDDTYSDTKKSDKYSRRSAPHHLGRYRADYENISAFGIEPLGSEKISEIEDEEADMDAPIIPPRPKHELMDSPGHSPAHPPVPPVRDPSSLQYGRYNQAHEKYPSWPVTKPNEVGETGQPITARAQSWTDHTNTKKEVHPGVKPRYIHHSNLRPVFEKSPQSDRKGEDGKSARNQSDPGFKTEFVYDKYGRVVQKNYENIGKNKFEDLFNSEPGYPPPRFDSDGHNLGDKEYSVPSPPERDIPGVDQSELSDKLASSQASVSAYPAPVFSSQYEKDAKAHRLDHQDSSSIHSPAEDNRAPLSVRPVSDNKSAKEKTLVDSSTSPLQSPQDKKNPPKFGAPSDQPSAQIQQSKAYIVKQTPYYNTSTQTDVSSYAIKTSLRSSDPKQCNAEVQVTDEGAQTPVSMSDGQKGFEEKSSQARRSSQKNDIDLAKDKSVLGGDGNKGLGFRYDGSSSKFEGFGNIQAKYAADYLPEEESNTESKKNIVMPHYSEYDPSTQSMLRSLSKEYYGGRIPHQPEKRLSSASSQDTSHHTGMREAESYSSVVIHPSENSAPFGRDDFGSKSSLSDSRGDVSSVGDSVSSKSNMARGRYSLDPSMLSSRSRGLLPRQSSASAVSHQREKSASYAENLLSVQRKSQDSQSSINSRRSTSYRSSDSSTPSQPKSSTDTRTSGSTQYEDSPPAPLQRDHDSRLDSYDSVFTQDERSPMPRDGDARASSSDAKSTTASVGRQPSMKKAYGIYDETEGTLRTGQLDSKNGMQSATDYVQMNHPNNRGSRSDSKPLDQIQEEADNSASRQRVSGGPSDPTVYDSKYPRSSDWRATRDKWKEEAKRSSLKRMSSDQLTQLRDRNEKGSFSGLNKVIADDEDKGSFKDSDKGSYRDSTSSLASGKGSYRGSDRGSCKEGDRNSYRNSDRNSFKDEDRGSYKDDSYLEGRSSYPAAERSDRPRASSVDENPANAVRHSQSVSGESGPKVEDLKKQQQQAVRTFMEMKTGKKKGSSGSFGSEDTQGADSSGSNMYEYIPGTSPTESVTDLINKASENLNASKAHRADSIKRSSSRSSSDYIDMARQQRKETEWSRLRSRGSFNYSPDLNRSNRSSMCSDHQYEDISVFSPSTPRNSYPGSIRENEEFPPKDGVREKKDPGLTQSASMDSGLTASPTYQNLFSTRRPPPPPPPRSPSPVEQPPALPPRNYRRHSEGRVLSKRPAAVDQDLLQKDDENIDRSKRDFGDLKRQFENSPREDAYIEKLRMESRRRMSAQPMSIQYTKTTINYPTTIKRDPLIAQEATSPLKEHAGVDIRSLVEESNKENSAPVQQATAPASKNSRERTLSDIPPPSPPKITDSEITSDGEELPPPPPDLLTKEEEEEVHDGYADDSYMSAAVRRSRRNSGTGNYKRSASAAALRPGEDDSSNDTDANSVFSDKKLGHQAWNSESALSRHSIGASIGHSEMPNLPGNIPAFKADVEHVKNVSVGTVQPLQPKPLHSPSTESAPIFYASSSTSAPEPVARPPQSLSMTASSSSSRSAQLHSPSSGQPQLTLSMSSSSVSSRSAQLNSPSGPPQQTLSMSSSSSARSVQLNSPSSGPPQQSLSMSSSSSRSAQLNSPLSAAVKPLVQPQTSTGSARHALHPATSNSVGGSFITPVVKSVQSPSSGPSRPQGSVQSPSGVSSLFSPRPFVSHHSREGEGGEGKRFGTPNSVRDRIFNIERGGNKNVGSPRLEQGGRVGSPKHTASPKPVDSSWKTNPDPIRTSSPKTVGGQLKAESSWETIENLSQSSAQKAAQSQTSQNNTQKSQRILESWRDDPRSRYPRQESFSSSSSNSTVSSSERRSNNHDNPPPNVSDRRTNIQDNPVNSATSPVHPRYRHVSPAEQSAVDKRSPHAPSQVNQSAYNQREPRHFQSSAQRTDGAPQGLDQSRMLSGESQALSPRYREKRLRDCQTRDQDSNGVHRDGETYSPRTQYQSHQDIHKGVSESPRGQSASNDVNNIRRTTDRSDSPRTQENKKSASSSQVEKENPKSVDPDSVAVPVHHGRQRSQEEIECDEQAKQLAMELEGSDKKLSEVLTQDHKRMKYMDGMFTDPVDINRRPSCGKTQLKEVNTPEDTNEPADTDKKGALPASYFKGSSKALVEMELRRQNEEVNKDIIKDLQDNDSLRKQKEELMEKLYAKLKVLKEEKLSLQQEIEENEDLGQKVCEVVERQARTPAEKGKFNRFIDELEKIVRLMLNLSGQLARAENAVQSLGPNVDAKTKKMTIDKRERLHAKYQDAKGLKEDIDERSESVATMLRNFLSDDEFDDYMYFIKMKSKLTIDRQDLEDKIMLGEEQIQELKKSIPDG